MTIRKGQDWGSPFAMPSDCMVVTSDADAARSETQAPFYVSSGDLHLILAFTNLVISCLVLIQMMGS